MIVGLSKAIVLLLGAIIGVLSVWGIYAPAKLIRLVQRVMEQRSGIQVAVIVRIALGLALIGAATDSRFPLAFRVLGWFAIIAAVGLELIGRTRMLRFVALFDRLSPTFTRVWLLLGIAFSGFLIYGVS